MMTLFSDTYTSPGLNVLTIIMSTLEVLLVFLSFPGQFWIIIKHGEVMGHKQAE